MASKIHIPRPSGPHTTGAVDLMVGCNKEGTLVRIYYPSKILDINTQIHRWTVWNLGGKYSYGWGQFYFPISPQLYSDFSDFLFKNVLVPTIWEAKVKPGVFPVIVYSHGLTSNRALSSATCIDLASHGYIVASIEHRDGSANGSFIFNENMEKELIPFKVVKKSENEYQIRKNQIEVRRKEASRTMDLLEQLNIGDVKNNLNSNFDLTQFTGKLDLSKPIIAGHSFGGGTALLTLATDFRFKSAIMQDPWLFPIKEDIKWITAKIKKQQLLFILMETFQNKANLDAIKSFQEVNSQFVTIRKGNHFHQTDAPLVVPKQLHRLTVFHADIDPYLVLQLNNKLMMKFLWENSEKNTEWLNDYIMFLERNKEHIVYKAKGTAKKMIGWNSFSNVFKKM